MEKKLDGNYTRMLFVVLYKSFLSIFSLSFIFHLLENLKIPENFMNLIF